MDKVALLSKVFEAFASSTKGRYVFLTDMETNISRWSKSCVEEFGLPSERMENAGELWEEHIHPMDKSRYHQSIVDLFEGKSQSHDMVYRAMNKNGEYVACTCKGTVIRDDNGKPLYFAGTIDNHGIASEYDSVTALYTKDKLIDTLSDLKEEKQRYYILFVGMYNFGELNNVYGYEFGNKLLRTFAEKLLEFTDDAEVYHAGGTKFALVSTHLNLSEIKEIYSELVDYCRNSIAVEGVNVTITLGGSCTEVMNFNIDEHTVYSNGLLGLDESMKDRHGELCVFGSSNLDKSHERLVLLNALRNSISRGCEGFSIVYQPVVSAQEERLRGAEALVRWQKNPFGSVSPGEFIGWLEDDPLFYDLGLWIARNSMRYWKEKVLSVRPELTLSINVSYTQLERKNFRRDLLEILKELDYPPENLIVELTERCSVLDKNFIRNEIIFLRSQGILTFIDDFGTGFSALELLLFLPVAGIKIDKSFVDGIDEDEKKRIVARAIIECASNIGLMTTVEGVETGDIRGILLGFGASHLQGYHYSKPLSIDDFTSHPLFKE